MNYTPKNQMKVDGKMSKEGADIVGKKLGNAALLAAFLFGLSGLLSAIGYCLPALIHAFK